MRRSARFTGVAVLSATSALVLGLSLGAQAPATTNSIGMELVLIQPGAFTVGRFGPVYAKPEDPNAAPAAPAATATAPPAAAQGTQATPPAGQNPGRGGRRGGPPPTPEEYVRIEAAWKADVRSGFPVTIGKPYYIGKFEVTQAQYQKVMGRNPSIFQGALVAGPTGDHPVENVTWADAQEFVKRLNALEKTTAYRLPSEFEWEWAARAGVDDEIAWADRRPQSYNSGQTTQVVGKMQPNKWGLHDMLGNVWEWVQDPYNEKLFADPVPPKTGRKHVLKGGGFTSDVANLSYTVHGAGPGNKFDVGFRVVRDLR